MKHDAVLVVGDYVAFGGRRPADSVVAGPEPDLHAIVDIADDRGRTAAGDINADVVAYNHIPGGARILNLDGFVEVTGDDVARCGGRAADDVVRCAAANIYSLLHVSECRHPRGVRADEISLDDVEVRASQSDPVVSVSGYEVVGNRIATEAGVVDAPRVRLRGSQSINVGSDVIGLDGDVAAVHLHRGRESIHDEAAQRAALTSGLEVNADGSRGRLGQLYIKGMLSAGIERADGIRFPWMTLKSEPVNLIPSSLFPDMRLLIIRLLPKPPSLMPLALFALAAARPSVRVPM